MADAHGGDLRVHIGVVDDFSQQENPLLRKNLPRGVGQINGPLDAVAKPELLGQADDRSALLHHAALGADAFDRLAAIMTFDLGLHAGHHIRSAEIDPRGAGDCWDVGVQSCPLR